MSSQFIYWAIAFLTSLYFFYRYLTSNFTYFSEQGIPGPKPIPIIGNWWGVWRTKLPQYDRDLVKKYGKVFGYFDGRTPNLWITDADLIRSIFVKDFNHFVNRRAFDVKGKVARKLMTFIRGQPWKDIRSAVTPAFTTGKIKRMSVMIEECAARLVDNLKEVAQKEGKINAKTQFGAFTMDVIARCAFGMRIKDLGAKDDPFIKNASTIHNPPYSKSPLMISPFIMPWLMPLIGERMFLSDAFQFFIKIMTELIQDRNRSQEKYNDFVEAATETISEYKKEENGQMVPMWTREEVDEIVVSQSIVFLVAGFDTTSATLTNAAFLLARNPEVQEKLYHQIAEKMDKFGRASHEMVMDFPYLDQVIHEVLRMTPAALRVERECNEDVTINGIHFKKGTMITVPSFALHYDEDYYPDPEKFDPDRWSPENKAKMNPYAWMPFGMGPRNCVGMRFALEELKIALCTFIHQFRFFPVQETPETMEYAEGVLLVVQPLHSTVGIETRSRK